VKEPGRSAGPALSLASAGGPDAALRHAARHAPGREAPADRVAAGPPTGQPALPDHGRLPLPAADASPTAAPAASAAAPDPAQALARPEWPARLELGAVPLRLDQALQPPPQQTAQPQAIAAQITLAVGEAREPRLEIRLDPPELGRVQIHLQPHETGLKAVLVAERPETQDLLRRHAETLTRDLGEAGYDNVQLEFGNGRRPADDERRPVLAFAEPSAEPSAPILPAPPRPMPVAGGLDIRL
jgi:hypothetical protein